AIRRELRLMTMEPVPAEELRAYVTEAASDAVYLRDQVHYLGMSVGSDLILGRVPSLGVGADELSALTPASLREVASRWLGDSKPAERVSSAAGKPGGASAGAGKPAMVVTLSSPSVPVVADSEASDPIPEPAPIPAPAVVMAGAVPSARNGTE